MSNLVQPLLSDQKRLLRKVFGIGHASGEPVRVAVNIPMVVDDYTTGRLYVFPMLFDTGADRTAFPASYAAIIGHDNKAQKVVTLNIGGIGGKSAISM